MLAKVKGYPPWPAHVSRPFVVGQLRAEESRGAVGARELGARTRTRRATGHTSLNDAHCQPAQSRSIGSEAAGTRSSRIERARDGLNRARPRLRPTRAQAHSLTIAQPAPLTSAHTIPPATHTHRATYAFVNFRRSSTMSLLLLACGGRSRPRARPCTSSSSSPQVTSKPDLLNSTPVIVLVQTRSCGAGLGHAGASG